MNETDEPLWVPVDEVLPEPLQLVLVWIRNYTQTVMADWFVIV